MAASSCRSSAFVTCKILGRFLSANTTFAQPSCGHQNAQNFLCVLSRALTTAVLPHNETPCGAAPRPVLVTQRRNVKWYTDDRISRRLGAVGIAKADPDVSLITDKTQGQEIAQMVNTSLERSDHGRLFAVVSVGSLQRKVTVEDVIVVEMEFPPSVGDRIRLEKVLMVGGKDFSVLGQPILSRDQAYVDATVIEKSLSHNRVWSTYTRRKRYRKLKLFRNPLTTLVINRIELGTIQEHEQQ